MDEAAAWDGHKMGVALEVTKSWESTTTKDDQSMYKKKT